MMIDELNETHQAAAFHAYTQHLDNKAQFAGRDFCRYTVDKVTRDGLELHLAAMTAVEGLRLIADPINAIFYRSLAAIRRAATRYIAAAMIPTFGLVTPDAKSRRFGKSLKVTADSQAAD